MTSRHFNFSILIPGILVGVLTVSGCTSLPDPKVTKYGFPTTTAFIGDPGRPFQALGQVRTKAEYVTLDPNHEEAFLCKNYYNKAVADLVKRAKAQGGDAVIDVKSVVLLVDGRHEYYATPECSDEGDGGQILVQGIAVKWKPPGSPVAKPLPKASPSAVPAAAVKVSPPKPVPAFPSEKSLEDESGDASTFN